MVRRHLIFCHIPLAIADYGKLIGSLERPPNSLLPS